MTVAQASDRQKSCVRSESSREREKEKYEATSNTQYKHTAHCRICVRNNKSNKGKKFLHKPWETQIEAILKTS